MDYVLPDNDSESAVPETVPNDETVLSEVSNECSDNESGSDDDNRRCFVSIYAFVYFSFPQIYAFVYFSSPQAN